MTEELLLKLITYLGKIMGVHEIMMTTDLYRLDKTMENK